MQRLRAIVEALSDTAGGLAGAAVLFLTGMVASGVVARSVFDAPFLFVEELSGYVVLVIVFLGLAHTMRADGHIRVDVLISNVGGPLRRALQVGCALMALVWSLAVMAGTWRLVEEYYTESIRSFAYLQVLLWIPGAFMVIGAALLALQCLALLLPVRPD